MNSFDRAPRACCFSLRALLLQLKYPAEKEQQMRKQYYNQELCSPVNKYWDIYQNDADDYSKLLKQQNQKVEEFQAQAEQQTHNQPTLLKQHKQKVEEF